MPRPANPTLREDILQAALRLIEEKGAGTLTMREVAGALGYSATALYQHFASKEELLLALKLQAGDLLAAEMASAQQEPTVEIQLRDMGHRYVRFGLENPAYYRLIFQDSVAGVIPTQEQLARMRRSWTIMRDTLAAWIEAQGLQGIDVDQEANVLWAMGHGITSLALTGRLPFTDHHEIFALFEVAASRWMSGVIHLQAATSRPGKRTRTRRKKSLSNSQQPFATKRRNAV
jgi:AcrR family transcriptional regulator